MKYLFSTIFLIIEILNLSTCTSRKKNIANLYSYRIFHDDGDQQIQANNFKDNFDFHPLNINYNGFQDQDHVLPVNSIPYSLIRQNYLQRNKEPFNDLNPINNEIFNSHVYYPLHRRKRRIIKDYYKINSNDDNKIEVLSTSTPVPNNPIKSTSNDVKHTYEVHDLESDAGDIDFSKVFKLSPIDKSAVNKGHGYLTFGKRYSFYVSAFPKKQEFSTANENNVAGVEDDVVDKNDVVDGDSNDLEKD